MNMSVFIIEFESQIWVFGYKICQCVVLIKSV